MNHSHQSQESQAKNEGGGESSGANRGIISLSLSTGAVCTLNGGPNVQLTISGRALKLLGLGYPKLGRIRRYTDAELAAGIPFNPVDSSGAPLAGLDFTGTVNQADGTWLGVFDDLTCDNANKTVVNYIVWWQYETEHTVHVTTEAIRVEFDICSELAEC